MLQGEVLVLKFVSVDGFASGTVASSEVTTLAHEVGDDTMEGGSLVTISLLSGAKSTEILGSLGSNVISQLKTKKN